MSLSTNLRRSWERGRGNNDIFRGPSCGRKLTYETMFTSVGGP